MGVTAEVVDNPVPIVGSIVNSDDGEDYDVTWTATIFEISLEPVVDIEDPTTA